MFHPDRGIWARGRLVSRGIDTALNSDRIKSPALAFANSFNSSLSILSQARSLRYWQSTPSTSASPMCLDRESIGFDGNFEPTKKKAGACFLSTPQPTAASAALQLKP